MRYLKLIIASILLLCFTSTLFAKSSVSSFNENDKPEIYDVYGKFLKEKTQNGTFDTTDIIITAGSRAKIETNYATIILHENTILAVLDEKNLSSSYYLIAGKLSVDAKSDKPYPNKSFDLNLLTPISKLNVFSTATFDITSDKEDSVNLTYGDADLHNGLNGLTYHLHAPYFYNYELEPRDLEGEKVIEPVKAKEEPIAETFEPAYLPNLADSDNLANNDDFNQLNKPMTNVDKDQEYTQPVSKDSYEKNYVIFKTPVAQEVKDEPVVEEVTVKEPVSDVKEEVVVEEVTPIIPSPVVTEVQVSRETLTPEGKDEPVVEEVTVKEPVSDVKEEVVEEVKPTIPSPVVTEVQVSRETLTPEGKEEPATTDEVKETPVVTDEPRTQVIFTVPTTKEEVKPEVVTPVVTDVKEEPVVTEPIEKEVEPVYVDYSMYTNSDDLADADNLYALDKEMKNVDEDQEYLAPVLKNYYEKNYVIFRAPAVKDVKETPVTQEVKDEPIVEEVTVKEPVSEVKEEVVVEEVTPIIPSPVVTEVEINRETVIQEVKEEPATTDEVKEAPIVTDEPGTQVIFTVPTTKEEVKPEVVTPVVTDVKEEPVVTEPIEKEVEPVYVDYSMYTNSDDLADADNLYALDKEIKNVDEDQEYLAPVLKNYYEKNYVIFRAPAVKDVEETPVTQEVKETLVTKEPRVEETPVVQEVKDEPVVTEPIEKVVEPVVTEPVSEVKEEVTPVIPSPIVTEVQVHRTTVIDKPTIKEEPVVEVKEEPVVEEVTVKEPVSDKKKTEVVIEVKEPPKPVVEPIVVDYSMYTNSDDLADADNIVNLFSTLKVAPTTYPTLTKSYDPNANYPKGYVIFKDVNAKPLLVRTEDFTSKKPSVPMTKIEDTAITKVEDLSKEVTEVEVIEDLTKDQPIVKEVSEDFIEDLSKAEVGTQVIFDLEKGEKPMTLSKPVFDKPFLDYIIVKKEEPKVVEPEEVVEQIVDLTKAEKPVVEEPVENLPPIITEVAIDRQNIITRVVKKDPKEKKIVILNNKGEQITSTKELKTGIPAPIFSEVGVHRENVIIKKVKKDRKNNQFVILNNSGLQRKIDSSSLAGLDLSSFERGEDGIVYLTEDQLKALEDQKTRELVDGDTLTPVAPKKPVTEEPVVEITNVPTDTQPAAKEDEKKDDNVKDNYARFSFYALAMQSGTQDITKKGGLGFMFKPSFRYNNLAIGLNAFLVQDNLSDPLNINWTTIYSNIKTDYTNAVQSISNILSYIDFIKFNNDQHELNLSSIGNFNYGYHTLVRDYPVGENFEHELGFSYKYTSDHYKHDFFINDLSLNKYVKAQEPTIIGTQFELILSTSYPFAITLGNILEIRNVNDLKVYPELGFKVPLAYGNKHEFMVNLSAALGFNVYPNFESTEIYDPAGATTLDKIGNFSGTVGLSYEYDRKFSLLFQASFNNGNMKNGMFNNTFISADHEFTERSHLELYGRIGYKNIDNGVGFVLSYSAPLSLNGQPILDSRNNLSADDLYLGLSYNKDAFDFELGIRTAALTTVFNRISSVTSFSTFLDLVGFSTMPYARIAVHYKGIDSFVTMGVSRKLNITATPGYPNGEIGFLIGLGISIYI